MHERQLLSAGQDMSVTKIYIHVLYEICIVIQANFKNLNSIGLNLKMKCENATKESTAKFVIQIPFSNQQYQ